MCPTSVCASPFLRQTLSESSHFAAAAARPGPRRSREASISDIRPRRASRDFCYSTWIVANTGERAQELEHELFGKSVISSEPLDGGEYLVNGLIPIGSWVEALHLSEAAKRRVRVWGLQISPSSPVSSSRSTVAFRASLLLHTPLAPPSVAPLAGFAP